MANMFENYSWKLWAIILVLIFVAMAVICLAIGLRNKDSHILVLCSLFSLLATLISLVTSIIPRDYRRQNR